MNINLSRLDDNKKDSILKELLRDKLGKAQDEFYNTIRIPDRLVSISNQYKNSLGRYLESVSRSLKIILYDDYIDITNTTNMSYILAPGEQYNFVYNPWMYEGIESDSYELLFMRYNGRDIDEQYIQKGKMKYTVNPFYVCNVVTVKVPFDNDIRRHKIRYSTNYKVDYDRFFHEYVFREFCEYFMLNVNLIDKRSDKKGKEYMLKWGMFTPYKAQDYSSKNMLLHEKERIVFDTANIMVPGNGYILTLSSAPFGVIKMK